MFIHRRAFKIEIINEIDLFGLKKERKNTMMVLNTQRKLYIEVKICKVQDRINAISKFIIYIYNNYHFL